MTSLVYSTGTVFVSNASPVVTGTGTAWVLALVTGGMFSFAGMSVPILSVESDTSLTLAYPWPGTTAGGGAYAIARETSEAVRAAWINDRLARLMTKPWGTGVVPDGRGTLAERDALNPMPTDKYSWLREETGFDPTLYFKTPSGWIGPYPLVGEQGPAGVGFGGYGLPAGGTTGQVPVKSSGVDGAVAWADPAGASDLPIIQPGDIGKHLAVNATEDGYELVSPDTNAPRLEIFVTSDHQIYNNVTQEGHLATVLADIAILEPNAVFMLGDIVHEGDESIAAPTSLEGFLWGDYFGALYASGLPVETWYSIAGNHDMAILATDSPTVLYTGVGYYKRTHRPPVYALTCGNMAFIFCGYEGAATEQIMTPLWMDQIEALLKQFQHTHNIVMFTHAPLYEAGLFDFQPSTQGYRLKPQARWLSFFDTYPIDAHFCGHSATDIITADESVNGAVRPTSGDPAGGPWKTYTTRLNANGHTTRFFLTGPHIEQKHWQPAHLLGGLRVTLEDGGSSFAVEMRNHLTASWVAAKARSVSVRFPIRLGERLAEYGGTTAAPAAPVVNGPLRIQTGRADPNLLGAAGIDTRKIASIADWVDQRKGDLANGTDYLHQINMPTDDPAATAVGSVKFGGRRVSATDTNLATEFAIFGTDAAGAEVPIMLPQHNAVPSTIGTYMMMGDRYIASQKFPMWSATYSGSIARADPLTVTYNTEVYDDFVQFDPATGLMTCAHNGVYDLSAAVLFSGNAAAVEDVLTVQFERDRGGVLTTYGVMDFRLEPTNANSRQVFRIDALIGVVIGDTIKVKVTGWAASTLHTITRATFKGKLVRGV